MADPANATKIGGLTRGKAILIAVLGAVLVGVLYIQFGRGSGGKSSQPSGYVPRRTPVAATAASASTEASEKATQTTPTETKTAVTAVAFVDVTKWKSPDLTDVLDYDPFALPESFPTAQAIEAKANTQDLADAAAAEDSRRLLEAILQVKTDLEELKQVGVQVIVRQGDQYVAMIGDRTVHVGEEIKGFKVTKIDPTDGVVVERKAPE